MAKNIDPKLRKIGEYLKLERNAVFTIPEYQRAYSWGVDNCDKLWQDIIDYADSGSNDSYFFGTIIINCQDNDMKLGLIDGQQRTTTFLLLLKALLMKVNIAINNTSNDEESAGLCRGLQARRRSIMGILYKAEPEDISDKPNRVKDAEICHHTTILENYSINEQYKTELGTILQATDYDDAEANVVKIKYKQKDNRYSNFFRNYKFFYNKKIMKKAVWILPELPQNDTMLLDESILLGYAAVPVLAHRSGVFLVMKENIKVLKYFNHKYLCGVRRLI